MRSYFRLKAHFIFNCHFIKWPSISKSENVWSWLHFNPNGPGCQTFFTLYLEDFQQSDLGWPCFKHNASLLRCSANFKKQASKIAKEETEIQRETGLWEQETQVGKREEKWGWEEERVAEAGRREWRTRKGWVKF